MKSTNSPLFPARALREDDADSLPGNAHQEQCGPRKLDIAVLRATRRLRQRGVYPVESGPSIAFDDWLLMTD